MLLRNHRLTALLATHIRMKTKPTVSNFPLKVSCIATTSNAPKLRLTDKSLLVLSSRFKSKKKKTERSADTENETDEDKLSEIWVKMTTDKGSKLLAVHISSLRIDAVLRSGLGIARNKIEALFYENKIKINEQSVEKKAVQVQEGDEIDIVKEINPKNPSLLTVARVEVLEVQEKNEGYQVKLRRCKNLVVENYLK